uniref:Uncharacterized protein n=1 Tax=Amorphochlora amoebiformis TaxID=1561963 RepID=A0A6T6VWY7_9EUKA
MRYIQYIFKRHIGGVNNRSKLAFQAGINEWRGDVNAPHIIGKATRLPQSILTMKKDTPNAFVASCIEAAEDCRLIKNHRIIIRGVLASKRSMEHACQAIGASGDAAHIK